MRILVVCQFYYPEPFRITDICEELVKKGHEVDVLTGLPNYPDGEIYEGYEKKQRQEETINGVNVHRCFETPRKKGAFRRFLNYYSFMFSANKYARKNKEQYDVVFVNQLSPIMMAKPALIYKKKHNAKVALYCLDLWPESLVAGRIKRNSLIYKYYKKVSAKIYKAVDKIAVTSKEFKRYFIQQFDIGEHKIMYLPQYAEDLFESVGNETKNGGQIDLVFAGNVGFAQNVEAIIKVAKKTEDIDNLKWHIVGDGSALGNCKNLAKTLQVKNVQFYGRRPVEEMPKFYSMADAMLASLIDDEALSLTLPGKVQSYMVAGKPILSYANGEIYRVIEDAKCGYCAKAESLDDFEKIVRKFCASSESERSEFGINAKKYYNDNFSKEVFFKGLDELLK